MERAGTFGALRRFGCGDLRRLSLIALPPALERLFIAYPVASREGIVAGQISVQKGFVKAHWRTLAQQWLGKCLSDDPFIPSASLSRRECDALGRQGVRRAP